LTERLRSLVYLAVFLAAYSIPWASATVRSAALESVLVLQEYAREHVLFCLVPAFFIAGAISVFVSQTAVMRYFGAQARKILAYSVASVSGTVLAVCSCTVLPLFAGIYKRGAGIGPAVAFLYSGPAVNILAIVLTARVLGWELGLARSIGAVFFAFVIGLLMALIFRGDEAERQAGVDAMAAEDESSPRSLWQNALYLITMALILISAAWAKPAQPVGFWNAVYEIHWPLTILFLACLAWMLTRWFRKDELSEWLDQTWWFAKQILPLLFAGVIVAGLLMGRPGSNAGLIPSAWVEHLLGGNSPGANLLASLAGALMYFATLTEVPILQGLIGAGMGKGPALALLLAGPALSLPNMLVIRSVIGTVKTLVYVLLVVAMATIAGLIYGSLF